MNNLFLVSFFRTKIFIRFPKTLFATEDAFEIRKHLLGMVPVHFIIQTEKQRLSGQCLWAPNAQ